MMFGLKDIVEIALHKTLTPLGRKANDGIQKAKENIAAEIAGQEAFSLEAHGQATTGEATQDGEKAPQGGEKAHGQAHGQATSSNAQAGSQAPRIVETTGEEVGDSRGQAS